MSAKLLPNSEVLAGRHPEAQTTSHYQPVALKIGKNAEGLHVFTTLADVPAVVLRAEDAAPHGALLKKDFQKVHNGGATPEDKARVLTAFGLEEDEFKKSIRTVGCGTNIYLGCSDGLYQLVVQRTAPSQTPEGVVQPGAYSRAAGGCTGDIQNDQVREAIEEPHIFVRKPDGKVMSIDLVRADKPITAKQEDAYLAGKQDGLNEIYTQVAGKIGTSSPLLRTQRQEAHALNVPGLTETVVQVGAGPAPRAFRAVVADDPKNGDVSGVDAVVYVPLPGIHSRDVFVADGERNLEGKPLGRTWLLAKPEFLEANLKSGGMKFSPAPAKVIASTERVVQTITSPKL